VRLTCFGPTGCGHISIDPPGRRCCRARRVDDRKPLRVDPITGDRKRRKNGRTDDQTDALATERVLARTRGVLELLTSEARPGGVVTSLSRAARTEGTSPGVSIFKSALQDQQGVAVTPFKAPHRGQGAKCHDTSGNGRRQPPHTFASAGLM
jgi:hypothetical protein